MAGEKGVQIIARERQALTSVCRIIVQDLGDVVVILQSSWLRWHPKPVCSSLINEKPHKFDVLQRQLAIRVGALSCRHIGPMLIHGLKIGGMHSSNLTPRPLSRSRRRAGRSTLSYSWQKVHTSVRHLSRTKLG